LLLAIMQGTPTEFYEKLKTFSAQKVLYRDDPVNIFIYLYLLLLTQYINLFIYLFSFFKIRLKLLKSKLNLYLLFAF
jgi:hypothetical protein